MYTHTHTVHQSDICSEGVSGVGVISTMRRLAPDVGRGDRCSYYHIRLGNLINFVPKK